jgi:hypothetical protein
MIAYCDTSTRVSEEFDRYNVPNQGNALSKFHVSGTFQTNAANKSDREWHASLPPNFNLRVDESCAEARIANNL